MKLLQSAYVKLIRTWRYEYWPFYIFFAPLIPWYLYYAFKARSLAFFSNVNPGIAFSGFFGEHKTEINKKISSKYLPVTVSVFPESAFDYNMRLFLNSPLRFPIIAKPNVGERGDGVIEISDMKELSTLLSDIQCHYLLQQKIAYRHEMGVFFVKLPFEKKAKVLSVTGKKYAHVIGNGKNTIAELMKNNARTSTLNYEYVKTRTLNDIPEKGEEVILHDIGNHSLGTTFVSYNHLLGEQINDVISNILDGIDDIHYGRIDLKVKSEADFISGKNIRVIEINGVTSEAGVIYDPKWSIFKAWATTLYHFKHVYKISAINSSLGIKPDAFYDILTVLKTHFTVGDKWYFTLLYKLAKKTRKPVPTKTLQLPYLSNKANVV